MLLKITFESEYIAHIKYPTNLKKYSLKYANIC